MKGQSNKMPSSTTTLAAAAAAQPKSSLPPQVQPHLVCVIGGAEQTPDGRNNLAKVGYIVKGQGEFPGTVCHYKPDEALSPLREGLLRRILVSLKTKETHHWVLLTHENKSLFIARSFFEGTCAVYLTFEVTTKCTDGQNKLDSFRCFAYVVQLSDSVEGKHNQFTIPHSMIVNRYLEYISQLKTGRVGLGEYEKAMYDDIKLNNELQKLVPHRSETFKKNFNEVYGFPPYPLL